MRSFELKIIQTCIFTMQDLFIADWKFKDLSKIIENEAKHSELTSEGKMYGMFYARRKK